MGEKHNAIQYHQRFINKVNQTMEEEFVASFNEIFPHLKQVPPIVDFHKNQKGYYDIETESSELERLRLHVLSLGENKKLSIIAGKDLSTWEGFHLLDQYYRRNNAYSVLYSGDEYMIFGHKALSPEETPLFYGKGMKVFRNELEDLEGVLWALCAILDVFFNFEEIRHH